MTSLEDRQSIAKRGQTSTVVCKDSGIPVLAGDGVTVLGGHGRLEGDGGPVPRHGTRTCRARIRVAAGAASGGAASGRQGAADVPGQQRFEGLDGVGRGESFEQEV